MPTSLFSTDMESAAAGPAACTTAVPATHASTTTAGGGHAGMEDQRALQIALELSMLGLNDGCAAPPSNNQQTVTTPTLTTDVQGGMQAGPPPPHMQINPHIQPPTAAAAATAMDPFVVGGQDSDAAKKQSQNMTECVPVPSSEHVAEIVGRQGCKIKALRAKTNTYIKTPVRGEEPVFVVTGRKEDVTAAKREIISAAEHFSQIRASRKQQGQNGTATAAMGGGMLGTPQPAPGQSTIQVRVPYRVVGLVVGPKGATIKRIQQQTHTYIVTPSRDKEPVFDVTGTTENVEAARREIETHIAMRTGGLIDTATGESNSYTTGDWSQSSIDTWSNDDVISNMGVWKEPCSNNNQNNQQQNGYCGGQDRPQNGSDGQFTTGGHNKFATATTYNPTDNSNNSMFSNGFAGVWSDTNGEPEAMPASSDAFDVGRNGVNNQFNSMWPDYGGSLFMGNAAVQRSASLATNGSMSPPADDMHAPVRHMQSDPPHHAGVTAVASFAPFGGGAFTTSNANSMSSSPTDSTGSSFRPRKNSKECVLCLENEVVAALVPCGHNVFCMPCAKRLVQDGTENSACPLCHTTISQAIRIYS